MLLGTKNIKGDAGMPILKLTKENINSAMLCPLTKIGQIDYWDTEISGFGLRVGIKSKTFIVKADVKNIGADISQKPYKTVKENIGRYGLWTPEEARTEAKKRIKKIKAGIPTTELVAPTLLKMAERYLNDNTRSIDTQKRYSALFNTGIFKEWGKLTIDAASEIEPAIILEVFTLVSKTNGLFAAKLSFQRLQAVLNYARILYPKLVKKNPVRVIGDAKLWPKTNSRTDCLKGNDFKQFYDGLSAYNDTTRDALLICLCTGMRNVETASLQWQNVNMKEAYLKIPVTKNGNPLNVPLSRQVMAILKRRQSLGDGSEYVFPAQSQRNKRPFILLRPAVLKANTGLDISIHGLRRSFTTVGEKLKLRREDINMLINHADKSITGEHYSCTDLDDLRQPLQTICNEIERLMINGTGAKAIYLDLTTESNAI